MDEQDHSQLSMKHHWSRPTGKQDSAVQSTALHHPAHSDKEVWKAYWKHQHQPWRTEPEIAPERQSYLAERRKIAPDIEQGIYPFKDIEPKLSRADIEWLLATHENGHGPIDWSDANQRIRQGLDLRGADLRQVDLRGLPLARSLGNLNRSEWFNASTGQKEMAAVLLNGANLRNAHLEGAELRGAQLEKIILTEAYLMQAILFDAKLSGSALRGACLDQADLRGAHLEQVRLDEAQMNEADMSEAYLTEANLYASQLEKANLYKAHLERAFLQQAHLEGADLDQANLMHANLKKANLKQASLCLAHVEDADLEEADLGEANLQGVYAEQTNLKNAHLADANLAKSHLQRANLSKAHLERAQLKEADLRQARLSETHLEKAGLGQAHLERAILTRTCLEESDLRGAHMEGTFIQEARLEGARLCEAYFDSETQLINVSLGKRLRCSSFLADVHWGSTNLAVVDWSSLKILGDESEAHQHRNDDKITALYYYRRAVRANRQLAIVLQEQGLNEDAARFAYHAQKLQRYVLRLQRKYIQFLFYSVLDLLAGYGYRPIRTLFWYILVVGSFAATYALVGHLPALPDAVVYSLTSFHGRGFFPGLGNEITLHNPLVIVAATEAVIGLFIEISFIATFTQRYFGK